MLSPAEPCVQNLKQKNQMRARAALQYAQLPVLPELALQVSYRLVHLPSLYLVPVQSCLVGEYEIPVLLDLGIRH